MTKLAASELRLKGIFRLILCVVIFAPGGFFLTLAGWDAFVAGQIWIHPKGQAAYLATQNGPHWFGFYLHAGLLFIIGLVLAVLPIILVSALMLMTPARRAQRLERMGTARLTRSSPSVPWWVAGLVLGILFLWLVYIANKWG